MREQQRVRAITRAREHGRAQWRCIRPKAIYNTKAVNEQKRISNVITFKLGADAPFETDLGYPSGRVLKT